MSEIRHPLKVNGIYIVFPACSGGGDAHHPTDDMAVGPAFCLPRPSKGVGSFLTARSVYASERLHRRNQYSRCPPEHSEESAFPPSPFRYGFTLRGLRSHIIGERPRAVPYWEYQRSVPCFGKISWTSVQKKSKLHSYDIVFERKSFPGAELFIRIHPGVDSLRYFYFVM